MTAIPRVGGRLLVVDASERLLLVHERLEDGSTHRLTPGGGVEAGEDPRSAAVREAIEETGLELDDAADTAAVLRTRREWSWNGVTYDQIDHFYVARVPDDPMLEPRGLTAVERQTWLGFGWWTSAQLRSTSEILLPLDLADVLDRVLAQQSQPPSRG